MDHEEIVVEAVFSNGRQFVLQPLDDFVACGVVFFCQSPSDRAGPIPCRWSFLWQARSSGGSVCRSAGESCIAPRADPHSPRPGDNGEIPPRSAWRGQAYRNRNHLADLAGHAQLPNPAPGAGRFPCPHPPASWRRSRQSAPTPGPPPLPPPWSRDIPQTDTPRDITVFNACKSPGCEAMQITPWLSARNCSTRSKSAAKVPGGRDLTEIPIAPPSSANRIARRLSVRISTPMTAGYPPPSRPCTDPPPRTSN